MGHICHAHTALRLLHVNINGLACKAKELEECLRDKKVDVVEINETKLNPATDLEIAGYHIYRRDRPTQGGGVAILVKDTLDHTVVNTSTVEAECCAIQVIHAGSPVTIVS